MKIANYKITVKEMVPQVKAFCEANIYMSINNMDDFLVALKYLAKLN